MKHRLVVFAALLVAVSCASVASAATSAPHLGDWQAKTSDSTEAVVFRLEQNNGIYRVRSLRFRVAAPCTPKDPRDAPFVNIVRGRRLAFNLHRVGSKLQGTVTGHRTAGQETVRARVSVVAAGSRRMKVTLRGRSVIRGSATCAGTTVFTARPK